MTLQGPLLVVLQWNRDSAMRGKTLRAIICTVCYCIGLIEDCLQTFSLWLPRLCAEGSPPCSTLPAADENAVTQSLQRPLCLPV